MSERGILYVVWGAGVEPPLARSIASVKRHHPELPVHVERLPEDPVEFRGLFNKARMRDLSPFKSTLYLDADTVVLGRLDYGFEKAERFGLACAICECPWARRYRGIGGDVIEYNTGVLFFTDKAQAVFEAWKRLVWTVDSSIVLQVNADGPAVMPFNDQAGFAQAIEETGFQAHVLPLNWNFRPQWQRNFFGPIRIWHSYAEVPAPLISINRAYENPEAIIFLHEAQ